MNWHDNDRINELLADKATQGLSEEEWEELRNLLGNNQEAEAGDFDLAAAALNLGGLRAIEPLPAHLRAKIESDAWQWFTRQPAAAEAATAREATPTAPARPGNVIPFPVSRPTLSQRAGWFLAAAACLALAFTFVWPYFNRQPAPAQLRAQLLARRSDTVALAWSPTGIPESADVSGDVVWNQAQQQGFMRFRHLAANDPQRYTYQLWIFDGTRDERYPVDGGYFNIPANQEEVVVPINAKLPVTKAALFALTIEPPGGVVVSKREKIVVVAKNP